MFLLICCMFIASAAAEIESRSCNLMQRGKLRSFLRDDATDIANYSMTMAAGRVGRTDGIRSVAGMVKFYHKPLVVKDCVIIMSLSARAMQMLEENVPHFKSSCDLISGHYDQKAESFVNKSWFREISALAVDKPYYNKVEFLEDLLGNHRDILFMYKTAFLMDDDIGLENINVQDFVHFGAEGPYFLIAPPIEGRHAWKTQDVIDEHSTKKQRCDVLQTGAIEHQAILMKVQRIDDFIDFFLEETRDKKARIPCDWGFPRFVCRGLDGNSGTGCAVTSLFGEVVHKDLTSQQGIDLSLLQVQEAPCSKIGSFAIQQNYFRYGRRYGSTSNYTCFSVETTADDGAFLQESVSNTFLLQEDPHWKPWWPNRAFGGPTIKKVAELERLCQERFSHEAYLSDLPKLDLSRLPVKNTMFHVHIPKVAGESFKIDAAGVANAEVFSEETCLLDYPDSAKLLLLLRQPRAHVVSQYYFCRDSDDPGPSHASFLMPEHISDWVSAWVRLQSSEQMNENFQYGPKSKYNSPWCSSRLPFGCYSPMNLQSQRLICKDDAYDYSKRPDEDAVIKAIRQLHFVGIQEAYQESLCLLHGQTHDDLPEWCDCRDTAAWSKANVTKTTHGSKHHEFSALPQETQAQIDQLTAVDARLYEAGVQRFVRDVRQLEIRFNGKILCKAKLEELWELAYI